MHQHAFRELLGTVLPIIQAPMAGVQDSALAIAVCEAGGLGSLPCGMLTADQIISEITVIRQATHKPFNLNFFCHAPQPFIEADHVRWRGLLNPYFDELGGSYDASAKQAERNPFNHDIADAIENCAPEVISFHFGLPEQSLLKRVKSWGCTVLSSATTVEEAQWLEANGADGIIAQGSEAGGHRGMFLSQDVTTQMGLSALLPQLRASVRIPVIAAGGISDSRSARAAMVLGACAVQAGTAYLLCHEVRTSVLHRQAIKSERSRHTAITNLFTGKPARGIVNRVMKELHYLHNDVPAFPHASREIAQLRALAERRGLDGFSPLWCGQNASGCREISAVEVTLSLSADLLD